MRIINEFLRLLELSENEDISISEYKKGIKKAQKLTIVLFMIMIVLSVIKFYK